jgi:hypothetical protein
MTVLSTSTSTEMMRAVRQHAYGGAEVLQPGVVPAPTADDLAADEVLRRCTPPASTAAPGTS